jgi:hypothetical protein
MEQSGETIGYTTKDYLQILGKYINKDIIDYIIINDKHGIPMKILNKYKRCGLAAVKDDLTLNFCKKFGVKKIVANLFGEKLSKISIFARHNPSILAKILKDLYKRIK